MTPATPYADCNERDCGTCAHSSTCSESVTDSADMAEAVRVLALAQAQLALDGLSQRDLWALRRAVEGKLKRTPGVRVYIAGPLSGPPVEYLANCARMTDAARRLVELGYSPFNPAADLLLGLLRSEALPVAEYKRVSMAALESQDCVLVVGGTPHSPGVLAELGRADFIGLPVFTDMGSLHAWAVEQG